MKLKLSVAKLQHQVEVAKVKTKVRIKCYSTR